MVRQTKSNRRKAPAPNPNDLPHSRATSVESTNPNKGQGVIAKGMTKVKKEIKKQFKLVFNREQVDAYKRQLASASQTTSLKAESSDYQEEQKHKVDAHLAAASFDSDEVGSPSTSARDTLESAPSSPPSENTSIKVEIEDITDSIDGREITPQPSLKALGKRKAEFVSEDDEAEHFTQQSGQASKKQKINIVSGSGSEYDQLEIDSPSLEKVSGSKRKAEFFNDSYGTEYITPLYLRNAKKQKVEDLHEPTIKDEEEEEFPVSDTVSEGYGGGYIKPLYLRNAKKQKSEDFHESMIKDEEDEELTISDNESEGYRGGYITPLYLRNAKQQVEAVNGPVIKYEDREEFTVIKHEESEVEDVFDEVGKHEEDKAIPSPPEKALGERNDEEVEVNESGFSEYEENTEREVTPLPSEKALGKRKVQDIIDEVSEHEEHEATPPPSEKALGKRKEKIAEVIEVVEVSEVSASEGEEHAEREVTPLPSEKALGKRKAVEVIETGNEEEEGEITPAPSKKAAKKVKLAVVTFTTTNIKGVEEAVLKRVTYFDSPRGAQQSNSYLAKKLPTELHKEIFEYLGPATQRILGATCQGLYDIYKKNYHEKAIVVSWSEDMFFSSHKPNESTPYIEILQDWVVPSYIRTFAQTKDLENSTLDERENLKEIYLDMVMDQLNEQIENKKNDIDAAKKQEAINAAREKQRAEAAAQREQDRIKRAAQKAKRDAKKAAAGVKDAKVTKTKGGKKRKGGKLFMKTTAVKAIEKQLKINEEVVVSSSVQEAMAIEKSKRSEVIEGNTSGADTTKANEESDAIETLASSSKEVIEMKNQVEAKKVASGPRVWENPMLTERVKSWIGFLKL